MSTINTFVQRIKTKLGLRTVVEIVHYADDNGLLTLPRVVIPDEKGVRIEVAHVRTDAASRLSTTSPTR